MGFIEAKFHLLGKMRVIAILLNTLLFMGSSWALYLTGVFTKSWYNEGDVALCLFFMVSAALSIVSISRPIILDKSDDEASSLPSLWWTRKKLEHLAKIKELKK